MKDFKIKVSSKDSKVYLDQTSIAVDGENLQGNVIIEFVDGFKDGVARLEWTHGSNKYYQNMAKVNQTYTLPIKSVMTHEGKMFFQVVVTQLAEGEEIPIFKSNTFHVFVENSLNAVDLPPEEYPSWIEEANEKLAEFAQAIEEVERLDIDANRVSDGVEVTISKKDGTAKTVKVNDGEDATNDYEELSNKPQINGHELIGNKTTEDLELNYDDTEVWNAISEHDREIQNIENDIDELQGDVEYLGTEVDNLDINKQNKLTAGTNITIENDVISASGGGSGTDDFEQLTNRPKYNGSFMNKNTNIPQVPTKTSDLTNDSGFIDNTYHDNTKVDKETGKGLSTNDYTTAEQTKLAGIETGAEVNSVDDVQIDSTSIVSNKIANIDLTNRVRNVKPEVLTTLSGTAQVNTLYDLGEQSTIAITLPNGELGNWIEIDFLSGATPTNLTITSAYGMSDFDIVPEANTGYSIYCSWAKLDSTTYGWVITGNNYVKATI